MKWTEGFVATQALGFKAADAFRNIRLETQAEMLKNYLILFLKGKICTFLQCYCIIFHDIKREEFKFQLSFKGPEISLTQGIIIVMIEYSLMWINMPHRHVMSSLNHSQRAGFNDVSDATGRSSYLLIIWC